VPPNSVTQLDRCRPDAPKTRRAQETLAAFSDRAHELRFGTAVKKVFGRQALSFMLMPLGKGRQWAAAFATYSA